LGYIFPDIGHLPGHAILSLYFSGKNSRIADLRNKMAKAGVD